MSDNSYCDAVGRRALDSHPDKVTPALRDNNSGGIVDLVVGVHCEPHVGDCGASGPQHGLEVAGELVYDARVEWLLAYSPSGGTCGGQKSGCHQEGHGKA